MTHRQVLLGKGRNKDKCTFTLNLRANSIHKSTRKVNTRSSFVNQRDKSMCNQLTRASIELSTRDLYCIQTIYDQEDIFKLLVGILYILLYIINIIIFYTYYYIL